MADGRANGSVFQPDLPKSHGRQRVDDRRVLSGIIFVNRNGLRWRDAPKRMARRRRFITAGNAGATRAYLSR
ncbi:transposase [Escherichia coli]